MDTLDMHTMLRLLDAMFAVKFIAAAICGGAIGYEREVTGKPAGLRTCILVCVGAMLYTAVGMELAQQFGGEVTRIAAQIVTGIGFIGAGVILHSRGGEVRGVTTAAIIWIAAALGMMIGAGYVLAAAAITVASVVLTRVLRRAEKGIRARNSRSFQFTFGDEADTRERIAAVLSVHDESIHHVHFGHDPGGEMVLRFRFFGTDRERREVVRALLALKGVRGELLGDATV